MYDISDVMPCVKDLKGEHSIELTAEEIDKCDEKEAKAKGKSFIKKYHHFKYDGAGRLLCKYKKGEGEYILHEIVRAQGSKEDCGICWDPEESDDDEDREWEQCRKCKQWYHRDCLGLDDNGDEASSYWECNNC